MIFWLTCCKYIEDSKFQHFFFFYFVLFHVRTDDSPNHQPPIQWRLMAAVCWRSNEIDGCAVDCVIPQMPSTIHLRVCQSWQGIIAVAGEGAEKFPETTAPSGKCYS